MDRNKIVDLIKDFVNEYGVDEGNGKCIILDESDTFFLNDPKEVKDFCKKDVRYIGACIYDVYADGVGYEFVSLEDGEDDNIPDGHISFDKISYADLLQVLELVTDYAIDAVYDGTDDDIAF
jgi:hypothetical protein